MDVQFEAGSLDHYAAVIGFAQVFLAAGVIVLFGYWVRFRFFPARPRATAKPPRARFSPRPASETRPADDRPGPRSPGLAHWERASAPLRSFIAHGARAKEFHARAAVRLDSADYGLQRLISDLAPILGLQQRPSAPPASADEPREALPLPATLAA